jgi:uncharacterized membrane protein YkoI
MMVRALLLAALLAAPLAAPAAQAQSWRPDLTQRLSNDAARDAVRAGRQRSLDEILPLVRAQLGGGLVKAEGVAERNGRTVYLLRWKTDDGRLIFIEVDAETGAIQRS